jgi:hypothetical protein
VQQIHIPDYLIRKRAHLGRLLNLCMISDLGFTFGAGLRIVMFCDEPK